MATKYGPRKKHNSGTVRTSTNTTGGSRTRKTVTTKTGNFTKSRSVNRNGTVRLTTTHKSPSGFITRSVKTVGSSPSKPKAPKFIKATPFKAPIVKFSKVPKFKSSSGGSFNFGKMFSSSKRSRSVEDSYEVDDGPATPLSWWQCLLLFVASPFLLLLNILWPFIAAAFYYMVMFIGLTLIGILLYLVII